ncbi:hypothetical protein [Paraburkholderia sp. WSM4175]
MHHVLVINDALPVWQAASALLPERYRWYIVHEQYALLFAVKRLD